MENLVRWKILESVVRWICLEALDGNLALLRLVPLFLMMCAMAPTILILCRVEKFLEDVVPMHAPG